MAIPIWSTTAGKLATINEREFYSLQLTATDADSTTLTYSKIAGDLPPGIELTTTGLLRGVPFEVSQRTLYTFVVRASDNTNITDRTFKLHIQGADTPSFTTASGQLDLSDSTRVGLKWILDGSYIEYQISGTDTDTATGQTLVYDIKSGSLPPGVTLSPSGLISGTILLADDDRYGPIGGYAGDETYDDFVYDRSTYSLSRSENYEFIVRITDGTNTVEQTNSIFVFTADYWRVSNTQILASQTLINGTTLSVDLSANRRPIFKTPSDLGTFRHENNVAIKIDVVDFDPLQANLEYSIVSGALPSGLSIDINSGEIFGTLSNQTAVEIDYSFTVRATRTPQTGITVYTDQTYKMKVIGNIDIGIAFTTNADLGTISAGIPSLLSIESIAESSNRVLTYEITKGSLPTGLTLSPQGNIIGDVDLTEFTTVDTNEITFDTNATSLDRKYTFTVAVSDQYQTLATSKEFNLTVSLPYGKEYSNMTADGLLSGLDSDLFFQIAQDPNINSPTNIFRSEDPAFGIRPDAEMLLIAGLEHQTLTTLQQQMEQNHSPKTLYFGDLKTAKAIENNTTKYEIVYIEMKDPLVNKSGTAISSSITVRSDLDTTPMIGPRGDINRITADADEYTVTTDGGLSFSISGSKVRYANPLSADLGYFEKLYPNAVANMRSQMKSLGQKEWVHLPLWMRTSQDATGVPIGYTMAIPLCYCKPGTAGTMRRRILDKSIDFKKIRFVIDRYKVSASKTSTETFTGDGSTVSFILNEIVHEEDIKIRNNSVTYTHGDQITADNSKTPTYLLTDTTIRSTDYEHEFSLSHDTVNKKTTITLTNTPSSTSKIRVERKHDKYLVFKQKGIN